LSWRVEYASGRYVTVRAATAEEARRHGQSIWPSDKVVAVRLWGS
jgi:hypothetical protein